MEMKLIHIGFRVGYFLETVCQNEQKYTLQKHLKGRVIPGVRTYLFVRYCRITDVISSIPTLGTTGIVQHKRPIRIERVVYTEKNFKKLGTKIGGFYFFNGFFR